MDVPNLFGHFLVNADPTCVGQNFQLSQIYLPSLVPLPNDSSSTVTLILPSEQNDDEPKSDADDNSDDCEDDESDESLGSRQHGREKDGRY
ncbi:hypothetical protein NQ317_003738 [Molorchus minor]|uniref:Uncharacterized protein n=1 Tax=Molorchus minor TaxID=1323400 RepID=A0ABQ9JPP6_9CUCU|nr:hypothetical protein NQ317_003738 [Molorchus minor]